KRCRHVDRYVHLKEEIAELKEKKGLIRNPSLLFNFKERGRISSSIKQKKNEIKQIKRQNSALNDKEELDDSDEEVGQDREKPASHESESMPSKMCEDKHRNQLGREDENEAIESDAGAV
ncbi:MAG: hypothetical protein M1824_001087, partial [Vezdaea acicularis]